MTKMAFVRYLNRLLIKRRKTLWERAVLQSVRLVRPDLVKLTRPFVRDLISKRRVAIISPADDDPDLYRRLQWGDTWAKYELTKALGELGYLVTDLEPDVVVHLYSGPAELPPRTYKIVWIYSHPEAVNADLLRRYDRIFCLSSLFAQKVQQMGFEAEVMWSATSKRPRPNNTEYDVVFVGNARGNGHRQIVDDVGRPDYNFKVWGVGYCDLPERYWAGRYVDYTDLNNLYGSSLITLNDHHPAMAAAGFVAIRVFDILASGGFCISDANPGLDEIFGDSVPQYQSADELRGLIDFYLQHPDERLGLMQRGQQIALAHTWRQRALQLMQGMEATFSDVKS
jgi:hypothetical protein